MSSHTRLLAFSVSLSAVALLLGCGGNSQGTAVPPPAGGANNSDLKGTYVFCSSGTDSAGNFLMVLGALEADGNGNITGGNVDINGAAIAVATAPITGGSYRVGGDGRGTLTLNSTPLPNGSMMFDFALATNQGGVITEFDSNGTGSGTLDLQSNATLSGSYAFNIVGSDSGGSPLASVGSFTLGADGKTISTGIEDFNDNNTFSSRALSGSVTAGSAPAPGVATLSTNASTLTFDVYPIDSTHLKFIESAGPVLLFGDAFAGAAMPNTATTFAFTIGGGTTTPVSLGGLFSIDGVSTITGGIGDANVGGNTTTGLVLSGSYGSPGSGGRTRFSVGGLGAAAVQFVAYPTANAGLQLLESDNVGFLIGAALVQSTPTPSLQASQGYAMNLSAANLSTGKEVDDIAEFSTTSSGFSGIIDINDVGSLDDDQKYGGTYTLDSPATGRGKFVANLNGQAYNSGIFYAVDNSTLLFLDTGAPLMATGVLLLQNTGAQGAAALASHQTIVPHRAVFRHSGGSHK